MKKTYEQWKREVEQALERFVGMDSESMPDVDYQGMYREGLSPVKAARRAIRRAQEF